MTDVAQHTISNAVTMSGCGLFAGHPVSVRFEPAPAEHGIVFVRTDLDGAVVPARVQYVVKKDRRTMLRSGDAVVDTCEHCLSALSGLGIDNILVHLDAPELPGGDGSASPFLEVLAAAGNTPNEGTKRQRLKVTEPVVVSDGDAILAAVPCDEPSMHVLYDLDYGNGAPIERQVFSFNDLHDDYAQQLAPARTFLIDQEARALQAGGVGTHLTERDVLVIGPEGPVNNTFRFANEPVRHKLVDLIGDLYLLGAPIQACITGRKSGHWLNHALVRELVRQHRSQHRQNLVANQSAVDIRALMRMMPHRYPMLLVDRVVEIEEDRRIMGIKNVTINEPFFQGHYPGTPVMPGVLVVEAMAQLSGVLIGQTLEHTGKLGILMSLDRVKIRRMVTPGDQLIMEAEAIRIRSRIAQMRCKAYVGRYIVAEAEVKFMLVDDEQQ